MSAYLIKRGTRAHRGQARAHLAHYDPHGRIDGSLCGFAGYNLTSNVPWGLRTCKHCIRRADAGGSS